MKLQMLGGWMCAGLALQACTPKDVEPDDPACIQEETQVEAGGGGGANVAWLGAVLVTERRDSTAGGNAAGTVAASFYDVTNFDSESPPPGISSPTCVGITGQPVQTGTRTALAVAGVSVTGLAQGTVMLGGADAGLAATGLPAVFGVTDVGVEVTGTDGGFVSVSLPPMAPPAALTVTSPDLSGGASAGQDDVEVRWTGGNGEGVVSLDLSVIRDGQRAALSCVVRDDGCHRIPAGLMLWLTAGQSDALTVVARRSRVQSAVVDNGVDGGAGLLMQLTSEARGSLNP